MCNFTYKVKTKWTFIKHQSIILKVDQIVRAFLFKMLVVRLLVWPRSPQYLSYHSYDCLYERLHKSHILIAQIWSYESSYESHTTLRTKARTKCNLNLPFRHILVCLITFNVLVIHPFLFYFHWPLPYPRNNSYICGKLLIILLPSFPSSSPGPFCSYSLLSPHLLLYFVSIYLGPSFLILWSLISPTPQLRRIKLFPIFSSRVF